MRFTLASILETHLALISAWRDGFAELAASRRLGSAVLAQMVGSFMVWTVRPAIGWRWHLVEIRHLAGAAGPGISSYRLNKHYT